MGKALIVPGADFSQNAIERITEGWLYPKGTNYRPTIPFPTGGFWSTNRILNNLEGKTISRVKVLNPVSSGKLYIGKAQATIGQGLTGIVELESFDVTSGLTEEFQFTTQITLAQGETLAVKVGTIGVIQYMQPSLDYPTEYYFNEDEYGDDTTSVEYGIDFFGS